jgi:hypothetical protein
VKVKRGDRVVCTPHSGPSGPGTVLDLEFPRSAITGEPLPPWVRVLLDKGRVQQTFRMQDVEKETRNVER